MRDAAGLCQLLIGEAGVYPSGRGGHKNSENVATFSEFLGGRKNPASLRTGLVQAVGKT